jgi:hypothetical protein
VKHAIIPISVSARGYASLSTSDDLRGSADHGRNSMPLAGGCLGQVGGSDAHRIG